METEEIDRMTQTTMQIRDKKKHSVTLSPPMSESRERNSSTDAPGTRKNFHDRNIEHLKAISEKKAQRLREIEEEKKKLEITRQRLAQRILKRKEEAKKIEEEKKGENERNPYDILEIDEIIEEDKEREAKKLSIYKSRYHSFLKDLQENNKQKQQMREQEELKKQKTIHKLKENLGLNNVTSKVFSSTPSNQAEEDEIKAQKTKSSTAKTKGKSKEQDADPEEEKQKKKAAREASEQIVKRAQRHILELAEKKAEEAKKEVEQREKEQKFKHSLREAVLSKKHQNENEDSEPPSTSETPKKPKRIDDKAIERLSSAPKRWTGPIITDINVFRKKYKLTEKDKIFVIKGCYPDIKRALLKRSNFSIEIGSKTQTKILHVLT